MFGPGHMVDLPYSNRPLEPEPGPPPEARPSIVAATVAELATRMEDSENDFGCRTSFLFHDVDRDSTTVVGDRAAVIRMEDNFN